MPLFKYVTLDRIDILIKQEIRYTQLGAFNDPFEMPLSLEKAIKTDEYIRRLNEESIPKVLHAKYKELPVAKRMKIPLSAYQKKNNKFSQLPETEIKALAEKEIENITLKIWGNFQKLVQCFGVLSLTETHDNLLMWAHYSGQHTGMVIEFDETHSTFNALRSQTGGLRSRNKVIYSETRPVRAIPEDISFTDIMLTKSAEWKYENEFRIARELNDAQRIISASPYDICLFDMPAAAIRRIILGARVSPADIDRIKNILGATPHLRHIRIQQASLDERRFALNFSDCS